MGRVNTPRRIAHRLRLARPGRRVFRAVGYLGLLVAVVGVADSSPRQGESTFSEVTQVLSTDLVFAPPSLGFPPGRALQPRDVTLVVDDQARDVQALAPLDKGAWQVLVYFDARHLDSRSLRWAAGFLAESARELTQLGSVEIIVADPSPRWVLPETDELEVVERTLSYLALEPSEALHASRVQRQEFLSLVRSGHDPAELVALVPELVEQEAHEAAAAFDRFSTWMVDAGRPGSAKLLVFVSEGVDLTPSVFYERVTSLLAAPFVGDPIDDSPLVARATQLSRLTEAYGWRVLAVVPPPPPPPVERLDWLTALGIRFDGNWDPKKARAYAALGRSLLAQGNTEEAEETLRRAIYHFYNHPKNRQEQAAVLLELGTLYEGQNRWSEARKVLDAAVSLDPSLKDEVGLRARLLEDPQLLLRELTTLTRARMVSDRGTLLDEIATAASSWRLSFAAGEPDGKLLPLSLTRSDDRQSKERRALASWVRRGTPLEVTEARLRLLAHEGWTAGPLAAEVIALSDPQQPPGSFTLRVEMADHPVGIGLANEHYRLSWVDADGMALDASGVTVIERVVEASENELSWQIEGLDPHATELLVTLENLRTGAWLADWVRLER